MENEIKVRIYTAKGEEIPSMRLRGYYSTPEGYVATMAKLGVYIANICKENPTFSARIEL